jgi:hypothetical protein
MSEQHTATPWHRKGQFIYAGKRIIAEVFLLPVPLLPREENGEFIVRACNSHDALKEYAESSEALIAARNAPFFGPGIDAANRRFEAARAALQSGISSNTTVKQNESNAVSATLPEGWKLVPIEPDLKMVIAGENSIGRHAWAKMLAAAPQAGERP